MTTFTLPQISLVLSDIMHDTVNHYSGLKTNSLFIACMTKILGVPYFTQVTYVHDGARKHPLLKPFYQDLTTGGPGIRHGLTSNIQEIIFNPHLYIYFIDAGSTSYLESFAQFLSVLWEVFRQSGP